MLAIARNPFYQHVSLPSATPSETADLENVTPRTTPETQATAAALTPIMNDAKKALDAAAFNTGCRTGAGSLSWFGKGMTTAAFAIAFNEMLAVCMPDERAETRAALANGLAATIGGLTLGFSHAPIDRMMGNLLNRCGAATIAVPPGGAPMAAFNFGFTLPFSVRTALIAGLVAAGKMDFFDTDGGRNQAAVYQNFALTNLISSVLSVPCGFVGGLLGSHLAINATPEAERMKMLTVKTDELGNPYVENNAIYLARGATATRGAVSAEQAFLEHQLARTGAGAISGAVQVLLTGLLKLYPLLTESAPGSALRVACEAAAAGVGTQVAVNDGWRAMLPRVMKGVVAAFCELEARAVVNHEGYRLPAATSMLEDAVVYVAHRSVRAAFGCWQGVPSAAAARAGTLTPAELQTPPDARNIESPPSPVPSFRQPHFATPTRPTAQPSRIPVASGLAVEEDEDNVSEISGLLTPVHQRDMEFLPTPASQQAARWPSVQRIQEAVDHIRRMINDGALETRAGLATDGEEATFDEALDILHQTQHPDFLLAPLSDTRLSAWDIEPLLQTIESAAQATQQQLTQRRPAVDPIGALTPI